MWMVRLSGAKRSLEKLGMSFAGERHRVGEEESHHCLTSSDLTACDTESEAWEVAERIVDRINRAAKVVEPDYRAVQVGALIEVDAQGAQRQHFVAKPGTGRIALGESSIGPSVTELVALQEREPLDSAVTRALEQWALPEPTPTSLNNILEIIRNDCWGSVPKGRDKKEAWEKMAQTMASQMTMSAPQLNDELCRCRRSFDDYASMGLSARHADPQTPTKPMKLGEASAFVHRLLLSWLRSKI